MANYRAITSQAGRTTEIGNAQSLIVGQGITVLGGGNLLLSAPAAQISLAATTNFVSLGGTSLFDMSASSGIFKPPTGISTFTGVLNANGGIERSTAGALVIGSDETTSTSIQIGDATTTTFLLGNLSVAGTVNTIGGTTFSTNATFNGDVTFGDGLALPESVSFVSGIGPTGTQDFHFVKELAHVIDVNTSTTAATAGGALSIRSGTGNGAAGGALTVDSGTGSAGGAIAIGATNAASVGVGRSGITTTVTGGLTQLTGAVSLTGSAASSFTTSAGALTLTSAAAATWSTAAGLLTINGTGGISIQGGGTAALAVNSAGTAITVQAGATLATTSTGNINLPNNGSARFQIETVAVSANVTSANLGTLTAGPASDASALHTHTGLAASTVAVPGTAGATLAAGNLLTYTDATGPKLVLADATSTLVNVAGVCGLAAASSGDPTTVVVAGEIAVPNASWDAFPTTAQVGFVVYASTTAGKMTITPPSASGNIVQKIGVVSVGGTGAAKIVVQIGDSVTLA